MRFSNRFQIKTRNVGTPSSIIDNKYISNNLSLFEDIVHNLKKNHVTIVNNKIDNSYINDNAKKSLYNINSFRIKSYNSYINECRKTSNFNDKPTLKTKNQTIKLKNWFILNNNSFKNSDILPRKKKQHYSLEKFVSNTKITSKKKAHLSKTTSLNNNMKLLNNSNENNKEITMSEYNNNLNKEVIIDNLNDLFKILNKQTVNNFNNKYRIIYKSEIPKKRNKILKIFEILKKSNIMIKLDNDGEKTIKYNNRKNIMIKRNYNSILSCHSRFTNKKMVDISIGTEDVLTHKILKSKHKFNDKSKMLTIQSLNLVNMNKQFVKY